MKEADFIKLYKKRSGDKDKKIVKEKIDRFWEMLFKALEEEKKVKFKDWGVFETRLMIFNMRHPTLLLIVYSINAPFILSYFAIVPQ